MTGSAIAGRFDVNERPTVNGAQRGSNEQFSACQIGKLG
jgi:hypothetical protein